MYVVTVFLRISAKCSLFSCMRNLSAYSGLELVLLSFRQCPPQAFIQGFMVSNTIQKKVIRYGNHGTMHAILINACDVMNVHPYYTICHPIMQLPRIKYFNYITNNIIIQNIQGKNPFGV